MAVDYGSLVGGIGTALGGFFGLMDSNDDIFENQRALMSENNRFQSEENQKARDFQSSLYQQQWKDFQEYNDPKAMVARLQRAGVSPASAFQSANAQIGSSSVPNPSSPGHTASPSPDYSGTINPVNQKAAAFSSVAQGVQALANARKLGVEGSKVGELMSSQIRGLMTQADYDEVMSNLNQYELELNRKYGHKMRNVQIHELSMRAFQEEELARYYIREENVQDAEEALKRAQELHERVKKRLTGAEADMYESDAKFRDRYNQAAINELKTRSSMQSASAMEHVSNAQFTDLQRIIMHNVQGVIEEKEWAELENMQKNGEILNWQVDAARSAAEIAGVNASHAEQLFWKDFIMDIFQGGFDAFLGYRNMRSWDRLSRSTQSNVARKIEQMKWEYGDQVRLEDHLPDGTKRTRNYRRPYSKYGME